MMKIMAKLWEQNEHALKDKISSYTDEQIQELDYKRLVYLVFRYIWQYDKNYYGYEITFDDITEIDHGHYQGALFYVVSTAHDPVIPEYLVTYVEYGSCCCCDALQGIQELSSREQQNKDLLELCRDIAEHAKCPYATSGWGSASDFEEMKME